MMTRIWHGATPASKSDEYLNLMRTVAIPDYHSTPGNKGAYALQQLAMHVIVARCSRAHIPGEGRDALLCQLKSELWLRSKGPSTGCASLQAQRYPFPSIFVRRVRFTILKGQTSLSSR